jgi:hypothetical protein
MLIIVSCTLFIMFLSPLSMAFADNRGSRDFGGYDYRGNNFNPGERGGRGNGATGTLAGFLLVLANLTVFLSLLLKGINRLFSLTQETKISISEFNKAQKKYLRGLHYYLNPIAIGVAILHFHLSTCRSILPDASLFIFIGLGILGLILKYKLAPSAVNKVFYNLHCSWVPFFGVILLLMMGHAMI